MQNDLPEPDMGFMFFFHEQVGTDITNNIIQLTLTTQYIKYLDTDGIWKMADINDANIIDFIR